MCTVLQCPLVVSLAYNINSSKENHIKVKISNSRNRRAFLSIAGVGIQVPLSIFAVGTSVQAPPSAGAFDNMMDDQYLDWSAQTCTQPTNLVVRSRTFKSQTGGYDGIAPCDGQPN